MFARGASANARGPLPDAETAYFFAAEESTQFGGTTSAAQHRINDLSLKVTSPSGTVYWGNNGLTDGNLSPPVDRPTR